MNRQQFIQYIKQPDQLDHNSIENIANLINDFPYFQTAHLLYLKNLHNLNDIKFDAQLKTSSVYITDRKILYILINNTNTNNTIYTTPQITTTETSHATSKTTTLYPIDEPSTLSEVVTPQQIIENIASEKNYEPSNNIEEKQDNSNTDQTITFTPTPSTTFNISKNTIPISNDLMNTEPINIFEKQPTETTLQNTQDKIETPDIKEKIISSTNSIADEILKRITEIKKTHNLPPTVLIPSKSNSINNDIPSNNDTELSQTPETSYVFKTHIANNAPLSEEKINPEASYKTSFENTFSPNISQNISESIDNTTPQDNYTNNNTEILSQKNEFENILNENTIIIAPPTNNIESEVNKTTSKVTEPIEQLINTINQEPQPINSETSTPEEELLLNLQEAIANGKYPQDFSPILMDTIPHLTKESNYSSSQSTPTPTEETNNEQIYSFSQWLTILSKNKNKTTSPVPQEKKSEKNEKFNLINTFIQNTPNIIRQPQPKTSDSLDISIKSTTEDDELISETLAKIYVKQQYYSKAIKVYQKLCLKYPEKNDYFAEQIKIIKNLKQK